METVLRLAEEERWAAALGGAALFVWGAQRLRTDHKASGAALATTGAGLIWRASRGDVRCRLVGAHGIIVEQAVAVNRTPHELFDFWRGLEQLPQVIPALNSVRNVGNGRSEWVITVAGNRTVQWTAEVINEIRDALIAWRSVGDSEFCCAGFVHFEPRTDGRGTVVRVKMQYLPPAGLLGATMAWGFGESPNQVLREGLRRFKQLMETGEIATTAGQPRGAR